MVSLPYALLPYKPCVAFNRWQIGRFVARANISYVINGNALHFPFPESKVIYKAYDVIDDQISPSCVKAWPKIRRFSLAEMRGADEVYCISCSLIERLSEEGISPVVLMPNGVTCADYRNVPQSEIERCRDRLGIRGQFVITAIGSHSWWVDLELLSDAVRRLRTKGLPVVLVVVGPVVGGSNGHDRHDSDGILFIGPVPRKEVPLYYAISDLGAMPMRIDPFTDNCHPIKVLEYGACRKHMIATPLKELKKLRFPHVELVTPSVDAWAERIESIVTHDTLRWQPDWDAVFDRYEWPNVLQPLTQSVLNVVSRS